MGKVVGLEDLLRQRQSLIEASSARSSEVEVVSLASSSSLSRSISPNKTPVRLNERCGPSKDLGRESWTAQQLGCHQVALAVACTAGDTVRHTGLAPLLCCLPCACSYVSRSTSAMRDKAHV